MAKFMISIPVWNVENEIGYKPMTTFWQDFSIADYFGVNAVSDTFKRAFDEWKDNYKYLTELAMVVNHKMWQWHEHNSTLSNVYENAWETVEQYAMENLKGDELSYYYRVLD